MSTKIRVVFQDNKHQDVECEFFSIHGDLIIFTDAPVHSLESAKIEVFKFMCRASDIKTIRKY